MTRALGGLILVAAIAFAGPTLAAKNKQGGSSDPAAASAGGEEKSPAMSKEEKAKLSEHMKMRNFISKEVKYPASKADITNKMKKSSIKPDDRKWFDQTLPDKTYSSAEEVYQSLGWDVSAPSKAGGQAK